METIFPVQSITMVSRVGGVMENLIVNYKAGGLEGIQMVPLVVIADGSTEERDGGGNVVVETQAVAYDAPLLDPATFAGDLRLYRSVVLAGLVLLIYDHTLTLATKVKFIWAAKLRPSIYWFFALRYIGLAANIANCVLYFAELSREVRVPLFSSVQALNDHFSELRQNASHVDIAHHHNRVLIRVEGTLIMRVFAMYGRNWWILICLLAVFSPAPVLALWDVIKERQPPMFSVPGIGGCATVTPRTSIVCDILVFLLTVRRAYAQPATHPRYTGTLLRRMTTDGAVYFGIIIIANAANLATFYLCDILLTGFLSCFITSLSMMLLARLMLNLHKEAAVGMTTEEPNTIELETLKFETVRMTVDDRA
ncbi:hypothetical protein B0H13DRAFT_2346826 [Mycena leptocephala]|nr:hypothetical protein B0H13DRAFT_2346826 [Mycena leptocephala]